MGEISPIRTICVNCKHFIKRGDIWYDQLCGAVTRERTICLVTGKEGYRTVNDLGGVHVTQEPHPFARDINDGQCKHYQA